MAVGFQQDNLTFGQNVTNQVVALRNALNDIYELNAWVVSSGGASFLQGMGISVADSATYIAALGNLNTLYQIANGEATQSSAFNFMANTQPLWGGQ
jgi:hypothetical protein